MTVIQALISFDEIKESRNRVGTEYWKYYVRHIIQNTNITSEYLFSVLWETIYHYEDNNANPS